MKKLIILFISLIWAYTVNAQLSRPVDKKLRFITPYDLQRWTIIDDFNFNKVKNWKFSSDTKKIEALDMNNNIPVIYYKKMQPGVKFSSVEGARFLGKKYDENPYCLGVKIVFPRMISTSVFLQPIAPYTLNGVCNKMSIWLLGRGRDVNIEIVLKDYLNRLYYLHIANLNYLGWKYWEIDVPENIPQNANQFPQKETLKIMGFLVTNHPKRFSENIYQPFYLYMDEFEVLLDSNIDDYPGLEIKDNW